MILPLIYVDDIIKRALSEDINYVDVATDYLIPENQRDKAYLVAKEDGVVCGLEIAMRVFTLLDETFKFTLFFKDGVDLEIQEGATLRSTLPSGAGLSSSAAF